MFFSPAMTYAPHSTAQIESSSCCSSQKEFCDMDSQNHQDGCCNHSKDGCCGNNCEKKGCCLHSNVYQSINFLEENQNFLEIPDGLTSSKQAHYYSNFYYQELIYSVWQPPKIIS